MLFHIEQLAEAAFQSEKNMNQNCSAKQNEAANASAAEVEEKAMSSKSRALVTACLDGWLVREGGR